MKQIALILLTIGACSAGPIIYGDSAEFSNAVYLDDTHFSVTGAAAATPDGWFLALYNVPEFGFYQTATFTADESITAWGGVFDNSPMNSGTGMEVYADGVFIGSFGRGYIYHGYWGFQQEMPFTTVTIGTGERNSYLMQEHLTITGLLAGYAPLIQIEGAPPAVPEPGTLLLMGVALMGIGTLRRKV